MAVFFATRVVVLSLGGLDCMHVIFGITHHVAVSSTLRFRTLCESGERTASATYRYALLFAPHHIIS